MKLLRRLSLPIVCLLVGLGTLSLTGGDPDEVTCGGRVMRPGDICTHVQNNSSEDLTYDEQRDRSERTSGIAAIIGWVFVGIGGIGVLFVLATAGSGKGRGIPSELLALVAADRAALAAQRGWEYRENDPRVLAKATAGLLVDGQQRQAKHVLIGTSDGRTFAIFDYLRRPVEGGQQGRLIGNTVWQVYLPGPLPAVELWDRPPLLARKQFEPLDPAEPKGYVVRSTGADAARRLLTPEVMAVVRASGLNSVQVDGPTVISHRDGFYSAGKAEAILASDLDALLALTAALLANPAASGQASR